MTDHGRIKCECKETSDAKNGGLKFEFVKGYVIGPDAFFVLNKTRYSFLVGRVVRIGENRFD